MTPKETAAFLKMFNAWRRGNDFSMPSPKDIGEAIDHAIKLLKRIDKQESALKVIWVWADNDVLDPKHIKELCDKVLK